MESACADKTNMIEVFEKEDASGCYALPVRGDSMFPEFSAGDLIVVDPKRSAQTGDFVVVLVGESTDPSLKQYIQDGEMKFLKSCNSDYPMIDCTEKKFAILGVVSQKIKRY